MDVNALTSLLSSGQVAQRFTAEEAHALVLRVGDEMYATILAMFDDRVLLDLDQGQRLTATIQTDQPLLPGQAVHVEVVASTPQQIALRLLQAPPELPSARSAQVLGALGLPDDALNQGAVEALVAEGQPVTRASVEDLRSAAIAAKAGDLISFRALAFALANDLPLTPGLLTVIRQGLAGPSYPVLADTARQHVEALLQALPSSLQDGSFREQLAQLLGQLAVLAGDSAGEGGLEAAIRQVATSLERLLAGAGQGTPATAPDDSRVQGEGQTGTPSPPAAQAAEGSLAVRPNAPAEVGTAGSSSAGKLAQQQGAPAASEAPNPGRAQPGAPGVDQAPVAAETGGGPADGQVSSGLTGLSAEAPAADAGQPAVALAGSQDGADMASAAPPAEGVPVSAGGFEDRPLRSSGPPVPAELVHRADDSAARAAAPQASEATKPAESALPAQWAVRGAVVALDRALVDGGLPPSATTLAETVRNDLRQLIHSMQFNQLQNALAVPTPGNSQYLTFSLPLSGGAQAEEAELRVSYKHSDGKPLVDPDDVHVVISLNLSHLKRVTTILHLYHGRLSCQMQAETVETQRLLTLSASELQQSLQQLGFAVDPIRCAMESGPIVGSRAAGGRMPAPALSRVNVTA